MFSKAFQVSLLKEYPYFVDSSLVFCVRNGIHLDSVCVGLPILLSMAIKVFLVNIDNHYMMGLFTGSQYFITHSTHTHTHTHTHTP